MSEWYHILYGFKAEGPYSELTDFLFETKDQYGSFPWPKPPAFYAATLELKEVKDTYLKLTQWGKVRF